MKIRLLILLLILTGFYNGICQSHSKEDSLIKLIRTCTVDSQLFDLDIRLYHMKMDNHDYAGAKKLIDNLLKLTGKLQKQKFLSAAYSYKANFFYKTGKFDSAIIYNNRGIEIAQKINYYFTLVKSNINLGNIYNQKADLKKSIVYLQKAEQFAAISKDTSGLISTSINLATVFYNLNDYPSAKKKYLRAVQLSKLSSFKPGLASAYNNLATVFLNDRPAQLDSAMFYYQACLQESIALGDENSVALAYFNIAETLRLKKEPKNAEAYYIRSKDLFEKMSDTIGLTKLFLGMADNYMALNRNDDAEAILNQGLRYSYQYDLQQYVADYLRSLSLASYNNKKYKEAFDFFRKGSSISDSLYNSENSQILYDMQTRYETTEKEKQITLLNKDVEVKEAINKKNKFLILIFIISSVLAALVLAAVIFAFITKKKANEKLKTLNNEIKHQKELVDEKQKEILDSIHYAKRIQSTLLTHTEFLKQHLSDNFVLFKPKDIVSGDFYWATSVKNNLGEELFFLACCDSTGHGVPGAFMSLLNIGFLSEAINEKDITEPHSVLNYVRQRLINSISKEEQKDGFDGILICINKSTGKITYAAANNNPVVITTNSLVNLKSDNMPVGKGERKADFNLYELDYTKGSMLYLFTDGYPDQFGGPKGKKFKYRQLEEILLTNHSLSLDEQAEILNSAFEKWKGSLEQVDDVLIIGIRT